MNKAIFLDRDGTLNFDYGYVHDKDKFVLIPGTIEGLQILSKLGYLLIIITNQSGIGRGLFKTSDYLKLNEYMLDIFHSSGIPIAKVYYCPHTEEDNCNCRKPRLGLFYKAIEEFHIDLNSSYAIGDKTRDLEICHVSNVKGILLSEKEEQGFINKKNLLEAALYIQNERK